MSYHASAALSLSARDVMAAFSPGQVPQIAAGEYWMPGVGVGGSSTVSWAGRNGTNTFTAVAAQTPDAGTGPGGNPDWTFVAANSDIFTVASPAGPLTATDGVYIACWVQFNSPDTTNRVVVEQHGSAGARRWQIRKTASNNVLRVEWSDDGTNLIASDVSLTETEGLGAVTFLDRYFFLEVLIDPEAAGLANKTRMWVNRKEITWAGQSGTGGASLFNGGVLRYGNNNFENQDFNGRLGPLYLGLRSGGVLLPSDAHRQSMAQYLSPAYNKLRVVCDGNSLTAGQGATSSATAYPNVLRGLLNASGMPLRNTHDDGHGGDTTAQLVSEFPARIAPFFDPLVARTVALMFEVRNSTTGGQTAAQIHASYLAYAAAARAAGMYVIVATAPPTDGDAAGQGVAGAANALIRTGWPSFADGFVDLELVPEFTPAGNIANPAYFSDGVHGTDAMYSLIAQKFYAEILRLGWIG